MNEQPTTKVCSKCRITKPLDSFSKGGYKNRGIYGWCKVCHTAYHKQWRARKRTGPARKEQPK